MAVINLSDKTVKKHEPDLCVAHQVCDYCIDDDEILNNCNFCGVREYVFKINPRKKLVDLAFAPRRGLLAWVSLP